MLVAEDHCLVREGVVALLRDLPDIEVVGQAATGREALTLLERVRPDVVVMDLTMPGLNGFDATRRIRNLSRDVKVVVLSMHEAADYVLEALRAGAAGFVPKRAAAADLVTGIRSVDAGERYIGPGIAAHLIDSDARRTEPSSRLGGALTSREREILQLIAEGRSNRQIARALGLSVKTVGSHRERLMAKLDIHQVAGLVRYAVRHGLVAPDI